LQGYPALLGVLGEEMQGFGELELEIVEFPDKLRGDLLHYFSDLTERCNALWSDA
jgi:hypothetical protein